MSRTLIIQHLYHHTINASKYLKHNTGIYINKIKCEISSTFFSHLHFTKKKFSHNISMLGSLWKISAKRTLVIWTVNRSRKCTLCTCPDGPKWMQMVLVLSCTNKYNPTGSTPINWCNFEKLWLLCIYDYPHDTPC